MDNLWTLIYQVGTHEDMDPSFRKRIILVNIASLLFIATIFILAFLFYFFGLTLPALFSILMGLIFPVGMILNHFHRYYAASVSLLIISNFMGLTLCLLMGRESFLHQAFYILCATPWLFFSSEQIKTAFSLSALPTICYFFIHFEYLSLPSAGEIPTEYKNLIHGLSAALFMPVVSLLVFYLSYEHTVAEERMKEYRARSLSAIKLASLGEMAGGIAHEINNPLAIISSSIQILKKRVSRGNVNDEFLQQMADDVERTLDRIAGIIRGLRAVSRDSQEFIKEEVSTTDFFQDILGLCSEKFKAHGVALETNLDSSEMPEKIFCDRVQLSQVLINLLGNAYDAVEGLDEKWVKVKFYQPSGSEVEITVTDSGLGVAKEMEEKIFLPFYTSKSIGRGTGLGLSISKSIIDKHGGSLILDKREPHTCFKIILPLT